MQTPDRSATGSSAAAGAMAVTVSPSSSAPPGSRAGASPEVTAPAAASDRADDGGGGAGAAADEVDVRGAARGGSGSLPRTDHLPWDEYFMAVAFLSAQRSKDPSTQVGACIVDQDRHIIGIGYNGFPIGIPDAALPWGRSSASGDPLQTKYPYVVHAEVNAVLNSNSASLKGCTMYVALFPCNECAKIIIQSRIREIVYVSDKYRDDTPFVASRRLLDLAGVAYRKFVPSRPGATITIDFASIG